MQGIYNLVDNYVNYTGTIYPTMLDNFMKLWGKDSILLLLNQDDGKDSDDYIISFGKQLSGFDFSDKRFKHFPIKIMVPPEEWVKVPMGLDLAVQLYLTPDYRFTHAGVPVAIQQGDIITFICQKKQYYYRVDQPPETYMSILFRSTLK